MLTDKEQEFLDELYRKYHNSLILYSFSLLDKQPEHMHLAEDCTQQTFVIATLKMDTLLAHEMPYLWMKKTCYHITISEKRKLNNRAKILHYPLSLDQQIDVADPKDDIAEWILREDLLDRKQQLMSVLTEQERTVYQAVYEENLSYQETEQKYNITDGAIRGAIQRIKKKVLKIFTTFLIFVWCTLASSHNI